MKHLYMNINSSIWYYKYYYFLSSKNNVNKLNLIFDQTKLFYQFNLYNYFEDNFQILL